MIGITVGDVLWYREQFSGVEVRFTVDYCDLKAFNGVLTSMVHGRSERGAFVDIPVGKIVRRE